jgi:hypothetical protein
MKTNQSATLPLHQTNWPTGLKLASGFALCAALFLAQSSLGYDQATTGNYASGSNLIEKNATPAPNDLAGFTNAVKAAYNTNFGGVFDFPTAVTTGSTLFRGTYGASQAKRLQFTTRSMQNVTSSGGTVTPISGANATTSSADTTGYSLAIGPATDAATGVALPEAVVGLAFTALSRLHATYPIDLQAIVSFSDGTSQAATAALASSKGGDDTFFCFAAPSGLFITNLALASFSPGTTAPVSTRITLDDVAFIMGWTVPPPQVLNLSPYNYQVVKAADGVQFDAFAYQEPIDTAGIKLVLNSADVSAQLNITGNSTNRHVTYSGLLPNQTYDLQISVSNAVGVTVSTSRFYTHENPFVLYDSGGFSDSALYPLGTLQLITNNNCYWLPPADAAEIIDTGEPGYGTALREMQMGNAQTAYLEFPPVSSGMLRFSFDARVSNPYTRTLDLGLNVSGSGTQASFISWGTVTNQFGTNSGELAYYDGSAWVPLRSIDTGWHHYEMTNYLTGPCAGTFDMVVDGTLVGHLLPFRTAFPLHSAMGRLRLGASNGGIAEYGIVDNLVVQAGPEVAGVFPRPQVLNVAPANYVIVKSTDPVQFDAFSYLPIPTSGISLLVNSNDVSAQLSFTGNSTNRHVTFAGLPSNQTCDVQITVSNQLGTATASSHFYNADSFLTLFDAGGFSDPNLYPIGLLQSASSNGWAWTAPSSAAQIVDSGTPEHGTVLRQTQVSGVEQSTYLVFPPISLSVVRAAFDARVSTPYARTIDIRFTSVAGGNYAAVVAWGVVTNQYGTNAGQFAYNAPDGSWVPLLTMDTGWHHYELVNYSGGTKAAKFDVSVDGKVVGRSLSPVSVQTTVGRFRISAIRGALDEYGEVDNLVITAGPAITQPQTVRLTDVARPGGAFTFRFLSQFGALYDTQTRPALLGGDWSNFTAVLGDGTVKTVVDTNMVSSKFYRLRAE